MHHIDAHRRTRQTEKTNDRLFKMQNVKLKPEVDFLLKIWYYLHYERKKRFL